MLNEKGVLFIQFYILLTDHKWLSYLRGMTKTPSSYGVPEFIDRALWLFSVYGRLWHGVPRCHFSDGRAMAVTERLFPWFLSVSFLHNSAAFILSVVLPSNLLTSLSPVCPDFRWRWSSSCLCQAQHWPRLSALCWRPQASTSSLTSWSCLMSER